MKAKIDGRMPPPLAPSTEALLAHERAVPEQPEMVRARALKRARDALHEGPVSLATAPLPLRSRRLLLAAAMVALLAGVAAAIQLMLRPAPASDPSRPPPASSLVTTPTALVLTPAGNQQAEPVAAPPPVQVMPSPKERVANRTPALTDKHPSGMAELELLSRARQSDARAEYPSVLALVAEHERSFPAGRLSEEREVLRIKALVGLGRASEARQYAAKFRRQFPRSVLLSKVDAMLTSLP